MEEELYEKDFYQWTMKNAQLLREGKVAEADLENITEEIESMGRSIRRALKHRLAVLLAHLLKWKYQPGFRSKSWRYTIIEQRDAIADLLEENPSLKHGFEDILKTAYQRGVKAAADETEMKPAAFPDTCPWPLEQIMDEEFWPG